METLQPEGEQSGKLRAGGFALLRRLGGKQQLRLEEGKPRRHDEIIGGDLQSEAARLGDEVEILLGERENGDPGEVDLLGAGERKEKIEGPLEALDIDDQRLTGRHVLALLGRVPIGQARLLWLLRHRVFGLVHHATGVPAASLTSAIASVSSKGSGACRKERARAKRSAAIPSSGGTALAVSTISANSPLQ